jgi:hypothetical protein
VSRDVLRVAISDGMLGMSFEAGRLEGFKEAEVRRGPNTDLRHDVCVCKHQALDRAKGGPSSIAISSSEVILPM